MAVPTTVTAASVRRFNKFYNNNSVRVREEIVKVKIRFQAIKSFIFHNRKCPDNNRISILPLQVKVNFDVIKSFIFAINLFFKVSSSPLDTSSANSSSCWHSQVSPSSSQASFLRAGENVFLKINYKNDYLRLTFFSSFAYAAATTNCSVTLI